MIVLNNSTIPNDLNILFSLISNIIFISLIRNILFIILSRNIVFIRFSRNIAFIRLSSALPRLEANQLSKINILTKLILFQIMISRKCRIISIKAKLSNHIIILFLLLYHGKFLS